MSLLFKSNRWRDLYLRWALRELQALSRLWVVLFSQRLSLRLTKSLRRKTNTPHPFHTHTHTTPPPPTSPTPSPVVWYTAKPSLLVKTLTLILMAFLRLMSFRMTVLTLTPTTNQSRKRRRESVPHRQVMMNPCVTGISICLINSTYIAQFMWCCIGRIHMALRSYSVLDILLPSITIIVQD